MICRILRKNLLTGDLRTRPDCQPAHAAIPIIEARTRIVETQLSYPIYFPPLLVVTLAVLSLSMAIAARLLDAIGRPISTTQLAEMAGWGWGVIGSALTLLVCGSFILPRAWRNGQSVRSTALALVIPMIVCFETVYIVGPALVGYIESRTAAAEQQCAVYLYALATLQQEDAPASAPSGIRRALLETPIMGLSCAGVPSASTDGLRAAVRGLVVRRLGGPEQVYNSIFIPSVRSLRDAYNEYAAAQLRLVNEIQSIPDEALQAWRQYLEHLKQTNVSPNHIQRKDWVHIAAEVRTGGIPVPLDWNPTDGTTFRAAVAASLRRAADATYNDFVIQHFQQSLPPGLDWESFYRELTIHDRWQAAIGAPGAAALAPNMGFEAFSATVYEPQLDRLVQTQLADLPGSAGVFAPNRGSARVGGAAVAWVSVPTVLLYVTIACILWHAGQLLYLGGQLLLPQKGARTPLAMVLFLGFVVFLIPTLSYISSTGTFQAKPQRHAGEEIPPALSMLATIGSGLRNTVFMGFSFGYDPAITHEGE